MASPISTSEPSPDALPPGAPRPLLIAPARARVPWKRILAGPLVFDSARRSTSRLIHLPGIIVVAVVASQISLPDVIDWGAVDHQAIYPLKMAICFVPYWLLLTAILAVGPLRAVRGTRVALDEGGLRCRAGATCAYWPLELTGRGTIERGALPELVIEDRDGSGVLRLPLVGSAGLAEGQALLAAYDARRLAVAPAKGIDGAERIARHGRAIEAWREALDAIAKQAADPAYRGRGLDTGALLDLLADARLPADVRAGAAYALLSPRSPELTATVRARLSPASPPLVLLLARLAPGGEALGLDGALRDAAPFLDADDRPSYEALPRA